MKMHYLKGMAGIVLMLALVLGACQSPMSEEGSGSSGTRQPREPIVVTYESTADNGDVFVLWLKENMDIRAKVAFRTGDNFKLTIHIGGKDSGGDVQIFTGWVVNRTPNELSLTSENTSSGRMAYVKFDTRGMIGIYGSMNMDEGGRYNIWKQDEEHDFYMLPLTPAPPPLEPGSYLTAESLAVAGDVYTMSGGLEGALGLLMGLPAKYEKLTDTDPDSDTGTISDGGIGGKGTLTKGYLQYQVDIPQNQKPLNDIAGELGDVTRGLGSGSGSIGWDNVVFSPAEATGVLLDLQATIGSDTDSLGRQELKGSLQNGTLEAVQYIYVDRNVNFRGTGRSITANGSSSKTFNLNLSKGWNVLYLEGDVRVTGTDFDNFTDLDVKVRNLKFTDKDRLAIRWTL